MNTLKRPGMAMTTTLLIIAAFALLANPMLADKVVKGVTAPVAVEAVKTGEQVVGSLPPSPLTTLIGAVLLALAHFQALKTQPPTPPKQP